MTTSCWRVTTVREFIESGTAELKTGPFGTQLHASDYVEDGTPVINVRNIGFGDVRAFDLEFIGEDTVERLSSHLLRAHDIVFGRKGAVERHALIGPKQAQWLQGSDCLRLRFETPEILPQFVSYCFLTPEHKQWMMNQCSHGATMASLNQDIVSRIPLRLPPYAVQQRIVSVLSAYDDLIENNTRRIAILEGMARSLYREWFVEFRFPGHENVEMVESAVGVVPKGWDIVPASAAICVGPQTKLPKEGEKLFVPMNGLSNGSMVITSIETRSGNGGAKFKNGDTLFARITPCLENGKTGFVQFLPGAENVAFGSTEFIVLRSRTLCPEFVYLMARSDAFRDNAIKSMSGATGRQRVREACFDRFLFAHPPSEVIGRFADMTSPNFRAIHLLHRKNQLLRETRDLVLPRLVSGELDVSRLDIETAEMTA